MKKILMMTVAMIATSYGVTASESGDNPSFDGGNGGGWTNRSTIFSREDGLPEEEEEETYEAPPPPHVITAPLAPAPVPEEEEEEERMEPSAPEKTAEAAPAQTVTAPAPQIPWKTLFDQKKAAKAHVGGRVVYLNKRPPDLQLEEVLLPQDCPVFRVLDGNDRIGDEPGETALLVRMPPEEE